MHPSMGRTLLHTALLYLLHEAHYTNVPPVHSLKRHVHDLAGLLPTTPLLTSYFIAMPYAKLND